MAETIELSEVAARLGRALREAGVPATPERSARFARALALAPPAGRDELYWAARVVFVSSHEQIAAFDRVFGAVFDGIEDVVGARGEAGPPPAIRGMEPGTRKAPEGSRAVSAPPGAARPPAPGIDRPSGEEEERAALLAAASSEERLSERDFAELSDRELDQLAHLMRQLAISPPQRISRREQRARRGERLDLRRTLRRARRSGGDPVHLARRRRRRRPRRLVVLCDISGSMAPYSRAFLQFLYGAVGGADAEAFVFATRLTRLTRALAAKQPQLAIERATAAAGDWSGGTRIAAALHSFNEEYGRRGMARGAVVLILSDGWEREDPERVGGEMAALRRLAYRIVWVNPRKASPRFAPLAGGMAAALPYCDALLSGHSVSALESVVEAIGEARMRDGV